MAEAKTKPTKQPVSEFLATVPSETTRRDCAKLVRMMKKVTGAPATMWGPGIVGFGTYRYVYATGQSGDWPLAAFSPRKQNLTVYILGDFAHRAELMKKLGRCKGSKACLYMKSLADVDLAVLEALVAGSVAHMRKLYPAGAAAAKPVPKKKVVAKRVVKKKPVARKAATKRAKR